MRRPRLIAEQGRRPTGLLGALVGRIMARETAPENAHALALLDLAADDALVEIGCGHGETLARAAETVRDGFLSGLDFSWRMHLYAMRRHRRLVDAGRLEFRFAGSDRTPYPDARFDKALAVHTVYFWAQPLDHLREVRRILKPGGRFVLAFRPAEDPRFAPAVPAEVYRIRPEAEVCDLVRQAGFCVLDVVRREHGARRMAYVVARRPADRLPLSAQSDIVGLRAAS